MFNSKNLYTNCVQLLENNRVKVVYGYPQNPHHAINRKLVAAVIHSYPQYLWVTIHARVRTFYTAILGNLPQETSYFYPASTQPITAITI